MSFTEKKKMQVSKLLSDSVYVVVQILWDTGWQIIVHEPSNHQLPVFVNNVFLEHSHVIHLLSGPGCFVAATVDVAPGCLVAPHGLQKVKYLLSRLF